MNAGHCGTVLKQQHRPPAAGAYRNELLAHVPGPVFLDHGTQDDLVQPARGEVARDALRALGQPVQWHGTPMAPSVCQQEVDDLKAWLLQVLTEAA